MPRDLNSCCCRAPPLPPHAQVLTAPCCLPPACRTPGQASASGASSGPLPVTYAGAAAAAGCQTGGGWPGQPQCQAGRAAGCAAGASGPAAAGAGPGRLLPAVLQVRLPGVEAVVLLYAAWQAAAGCVWQLLPHPAITISRCTQPLHTATAHSHCTQPLHTATAHQPLHTATAHSHCTQPLHTATVHQPLHTATAHQPLHTATAHSHCTQPLHISRCTHADMPHAALPLPVSEQDAA